MIRIQFKDLKVKDKFVMYWNSKFPLTKNTETTAIWFIGKSKFSRQFSDWEFVYKID